MTVFLRPARSTDAGAIGAILSEFIDTTAWMPRIHTRAEDLSFAGRMIDKGWVTVAETPSVRAFLAQDETEVNALYVSSASRGRGLGSRLISAAKSRSDRLCLWTFQANYAAQRFYLRHGFREVTRTDGAGNDEKMPDIRYRWERTSS